MNFIQMAKENPEKYPANMGQPWTTEETTQLLLLASKKLKMDVIADTHERTVGSIVSKLKSIAVDLYLNGSKTLDEIALMTGLSVETIKDSIEKRRQQKQRKPKQIKEKKDADDPEPTNREIMLALKEIQQTLSMLVRNIQ